MVANGPSVMVTEAPTVMSGTDGVLRIGAWDADPEPPPPSRPLELITDSEGGRGLALVRACADLWGWQPLARHGTRGKYVWCELLTA
ncbi:ATP-binding protein [Streptomyces sp. W16]|nr:ATP-binding protein [Streptomyces sp. W16]MDV9171635.1 ATP-binding protein [Streptomyces sp. W16]